VKHHRQDVRKSAELKPSDVINVIPISLDKKTAEKPRDSTHTTVAAPTHEGATEDEFLKDFPISQGLTTAEGNQLLEKYGKNELPEKVTPKWLIFVRLLYQPMPVMIWIAAIVEIIIANYIDMAILIAINLVNASLSFYETNKAGDAIAALKASLKPTAICFRDGHWNNNVSFIG
jgi:magnesium-transporting ATPase (P-type)